MTTYVCSLARTRVDRDSFIIFIKSLYGTWRGVDLCTSLVFGLLLDGSLLTRAMNGLDNNLRVQSK